MIGQTLGHYEILSPLGAGGMGQVYRARDTTLDRDVAIKVLPEDFADDADRLARFEREAKLLASLNHPNIATIFGFEESDRVRFIAMELVEGQSLAERIEASGRIEINEALEIARRIALALEAAHEAGVIHRDLKPANVQVATDGTVKVLDFGLAKAYEAEGSDPSSDLSHSPTIMAATGTGVIMGTAPYMSPEQARGKPIDKRTDIWAFGCVLYEMLAGKRAFGGEDVSETLASILRDQPDWNALPDTLPPGVAPFLRRCLAKDPHRRLHDIADMRLALGGAFELREDDATLTASPRFSAALPWTVATIAILVAVAAGARLGREDHMRSVEPVRFTLQLPEDASTVHSGSLAISPDGSQLVFPGRRGPTGTLYLRPLGELEPRSLRGTEGGVVPFFSPDGTWLGFYANGQLRKVPVGGDVPVTIVEKAGFYGASWGDRGNIAYVEAVSSPLMAVPADGGAPHELTNLQPGELGHWWPQFLPGERALLFTNYATEPLIEVHLLDTGERRVLIENGAFGRYVPSGHLLFVRDGALLAAPFDLERLEIVGGELPILEDIAFQSTEAGSQYAVSDTGLLVYLSSSAFDPPAELTVVDRDGRIDRLPVQVGRYQGPRVSADGSRLAVVIREAGHDLWSLDLERGSRLRVTNLPGTEMSPVWTPDGRELIFAYEGPRRFFEIARIAADGAGDLDPLLGVEAPERDSYPGSINPDGTVLAYSVGASGSTRHLDTPAGW